MGIGGGFEQGILLKHSLKLGLRLAINLYQVNQNS